MTLWIEHSHLAKKSWTGHLLWLQLLNNMRRRARSALKICNFRRVVSSWVVKTFLSTLESSVSSSFFFQQGAIDFHGCMIDMPTVQQARNVLRLAELTQAEWAEKVRAIIMNFSSIGTSKELKCSIVHLNKPSVNSYTQTMVQNKESFKFTEEPLAATFEPFSCSGGRGN